MWHHESSCTGVVSTCAAGPAADPSGRAVTSAVTAPAPAAASSASVVAARAAVVRDRDADTAALRALGRVERLARDHRGRPRVAAERVLEQCGDRHRAVLGRPAADHGDRLPRPAARRGSRPRSRSRRRGGESSSDRTSAGCAATISSVTHGGPSRSSGKSSSGSDTAKAIEARAQRVGDLREVLLLDDERRRDGDRAEQRPHQHARLARGLRRPWRPRRARARARPGRAGLRPAGPVRRAPR